MGWLERTRNVVAPDARLSELQRELMRVRDLRIQRRGGGRQRQDQYEEAKSCKGQPRAEHMA